jgi:hypothetical protein
MDNGPGQSPAVQLCRGPLRDATKRRPIITAMTWYNVKETIRRSGLKHSVLNKNTPCETVHVEQQTGNFISDTMLFLYEPEKWERDMLRLNIPLEHCAVQLSLFAG